VFDWLFEGRLAVYIPLIALAVVCLLIWTRTPRRHYLVGFGVALGLIGVYFLLDWAVVTDREHIENGVRAMAGGVRARNVSGIMAQVSDDFRKGTTGKEQFRQFVETAVQRHDVEEVEVWEFSFPDDFRAPFTIPTTRRTTTVGRVFFRAKPKGGFSSGAEFFPCAARFVRDPDGQWRLLDFEVFDTIQTNQPIRVPGM
jgi:hypothetical protein